MNPSNWEDREGKDPVESYNCIEEMTNDILFQQIKDAILEVHDKDKLSFIYHNPHARE